LVSDSKLEEAFKALPQSEAEELPERDSELLALLQEIPGVVGAVETAPDGTLLAADVPDGKGEREAMLAVLLGGTADQLGDILNLDTFAGGVVSLPSQRLVILKHGESYVGLVLGAQASAALVSRAAAQLLES
jgi:predicted regulator of Ras-like GTPase activity (Roadblock/LC7/MglB family)